MRRGTLLLALLALPGCATTSVPPAPVTASAVVAIDELVRLNAAAQAAVAVFVPWLSPERAAKVQAAAVLVNAAIGRVAAARDLAAQAAAIDDARGAIAGYKWLAGS